VVFTVKKLTQTASIRLDACKVRQKYKKVAEEVVFCKKTKQARCLALFDAKTARCGHKKMLGNGLRWDYFKHKYFIPYPRSFQTIRLV
jgi:hypothetical protein